MFWPSCPYFHCVSAEQDELLECDSQSLGQQIGYHGEALPIAALCDLRVREYGYVPGIRRRIVHNDYVP